MIKRKLSEGSPKSQVKAFIDSLKIDSLEIFRGDFHQFSQDPINTLDKQKTDALGNRMVEYISARISNVETGLWYHEDIRIDFYIDKDGRMIDYTVKRIGSD